MKLIRRCGDGAGSAYKTRRPRRAPPHSTDTALRSILVCHRPSACILRSGSATCRRTTPPHCGDVDGPRQTIRMLCCSVPCCPAVWLSGCLAVLLSGCLAVSTSILVSLVYLIGWLINMEFTPPFSHVPCLSGRSAVEALGGLYPCCSSPDARATRDMRHATCAHSISNRHSYLHMYKRHAVSQDSGIIIIIIVRFAHYLLVSVETLTRQPPSSNYSRAAATYSVNLLATLDWLAPVSRRTRPTSPRRNGRCTFVYRS